MEREVGRIKKNETTDIVIKIDDFGGSEGVTIREYIHTDNYTGFTRNGTRIPRSQWEEFVKIIGEVKF